MDKRALIIISLLIFGFAEGGSNKVYYIQYPNYETWKHTPDKIRFFFSKQAAEKASEKVTEDNECVVKIIPKVETIEYLNPKDLVNKLNKVFEKYITNQYEIK